MQEPQQARSRETLSRLLSAAQWLLEERGLEATTVPAIARRAGVSVGVVYRRFPDKDALLREVYERFFEEMAEKSAVGLAAVAERKLPLPRLARSLIISIVHGYRARRGIIRALSHYARRHHDAKFRKAAIRLNRQSMDKIAELLLSYRDEMSHPDPETAIEFGLIAVTSVVRLMVIEEEPLHPYTPKNLEEELVRLFFGYVGISER